MDIYSEELISDFVSYFAENDTETIANILNKEESKGRGKKSLAYNLIKQIREQQLGDIAVYVGIKLANMSINPKWTADEVLQVINSKNFIDKEFVPFLSQEYFNDVEMSDKEMKDVASKIKDNILKNEKETVKSVYELTSARKKDTNVIFAHQLSTKQLQNIQNSIIACLKVFAGCLKEYKVTNYLNYDIEGKESTYIFFTNLMFGDGSLSNEIVMLLQKLGEIKEKGTVTSPKGKKKLDTWLKNLTKAKEVFGKISQRKILWPEADKNINSEDSLKTYFIQIEAERPKALEILQRYKKRIAKNQNDIPTGDDEVDENVMSKEWSDEKVTGLINTTVKALLKGKEVYFNTPDEMIQKANEIAEQLCAENKGLAKYIKDQQHPDYIGELASMIASRIHSNKALMGRPSKEEVV